MFQLCFWENVALDSVSGLSESPPGPEALNNLAVVIKIRVSDIAKQNASEYKRSCHIMIYYSFDNVFAVDFFQSK